MIERPIEMFLGRQNMRVMLVEDWSRAGGTTAGLYALVARLYNLGFRGADLIPDRRFLGVM